MERFEVPWNYGFLSAMNVPCWSQSQAGLNHNNTRRCPETATATTEISSTLILTTFTMCTTRYALGQWGGMGNSSTLHHLSKVIYQLGGPHAHLKICIPHPACMAAHETDHAVLQEDGTQSKTAHWRYFHHFSASCQQNNAHPRLVHDSWRTESSWINTAMWKRSTTSRGIHLIALPGPTYCWTQQDLHAPAFISVSFQRKEVHSITMVQILLNISKREQLKSRDNGTI